MTIYVKDPSVSEAVRELAKLRGVSLTRAVHDAVCKALEEELAHKAEKFSDTVRRLQDEVARAGTTGLKADKEFFDELSGDL